MHFLYNVCLKFGIWNAHMQYCVKNGIKCIICSVKQNGNGGIWNMQSRNHSVCNNVNACEFERTANTWWLISSLYGMADPMYRWNVVRFHSYILQYLYFALYNSKSKQYVFFSFAAYCAYDIYMPSLFLMMEYCNLSVTIQSHMLKVWNFEWGNWNMPFLAFSLHICIKK